MYITIKLVAVIFFFFNDTATTEIYTLSLHDALPICLTATSMPPTASAMNWSNTDSAEYSAPLTCLQTKPYGQGPARSEEHTSELQSRQYLVCRLLLEKKKIIQELHPTTMLPTVDLCL